MKNCYTEDVFKPSSGRIGKQEMFVGIILPMKTLMIVIRFRMVLLHSWSCLSFFYQLPPFSLGAVFSLVLLYIEKALSGSHSHIAFLSADSNVCRRNWLGLSRK